MTQNQVLAYVKWIQLIFFSFDRIVSLKSHSFFFFVESSIALFVEPGKTRACAVYN